ncbi:MAG: OpgC domain-containing protein [Solirubrobacteraceae bacterium]|nr:OpgC domain-containing protein [Solirubrobacteraceae bacterium]
MAVTARTITAPAAEPRVPAPPRPAGRDVALDLVRGLAIVILLVNHLRYGGGLEVVTHTVLSAAEVLVAVSGVVVGMVFGRRWLADGARATTGMLLRRARKLYVASVVVVALVGLLTLVPGLNAEAVTVSPHGGSAHYDHDHPLRLALAIITLEAGPWQFNILGFFIAAIALTPLVLVALERGRWPALLALSWALWLLGRAWPHDVLPMQSEGPFPILVWQLLFVHGVVLGWHRDAVGRWMRAHGGALLGAIVAVALVAAVLRLQAKGLEPFGLSAVIGREDWTAWDLAHYEKTTLDPARVLTMMTVAAAAYLGFRRFEPLAERTVGRVLLPLGRNSFYLFIMHVFVCLAVASVPFLAAERVGWGGAVAVQAGCLALLWLMVTRRFLFRWVPR